MRPNSYMSTRLSARSVIGSIRKRFDLLRRSRLHLLLSLVAFAIFVCVACRRDSDPQSLRPRQLRDVPARRLAYAFRADSEAPRDLNSEDTSARLPAIQQDFDTRRKDDALLRTVTSPDGQRALALYGTSDAPGPTFRIDLYSAEGQFLRNLTPPDLAGVFPDSVLWSSDGGLIAFVGRKSLKPQPSPTPFEELPELTESPGATPLPSPSIAPAFGIVPLFNTEQIYLCNRDGFDLKPLTTREGLIYFAVSWAPDGHALAALACKENEWDAREKEFKTPAGRPRLITLEGQERLLDDALAEAPPVWSPDSSKVATAFSPKTAVAFDVDVGIYDAASKAPTQARIPLREQLLAASAAFEEQPSASAQKTTAPPPRAGHSSTPTPLPTPQIGDVPVSFNPIVRLEWTEPGKLYVETAYVSMRSELIRTFSRWHLVTLSPQAAVLGR